MLLVAAAAIAFAWTMIDVGWRGIAYDMLPNIVAGRLVATDRASHLYAHDPVLFNRVDDAEFSRAAAEMGLRVESTPFVYPPLVAYAMQSAATRPLSLTLQVWPSMSALLLLLGLACTARLYLPDAGSAWLALALTALCAFEPIRYGLWLGQTTSLVFALMMGGLILQRRGHPIAAGVCVALAAYLKLTPIVLAAVWIWRGPRRAAASCGLTIVALWATSIALMGVGANLEYVHRVNEIRRIGLVAYNNHSLLAFLMRVTASAAERVQWRMLMPGAGILAMHLAIAAACGTIGLMAYRRVATRSPAHARALLEALALLAILLVPNIAWTHYFVLLIPVAAVAMALRRADDVASLLMTVAALALCCRPVLADQTLPPPDVHSVALISLPTMAAVLVGMALVRVAMRR